MSSSATSLNQQVDIPASMTQSTGPTILYPEISQRLTDETKTQTTTSQPYLNADTNHVLLQHHHQSEQTSPVSASTATGGVRPHPPHCLSKSIGHLPLRKSSLVFSKTALNSKDCSDHNLYATCQYSQSLDPNLQIKVHPSHSQVATLSKARRSDSLDSKNLVEENLLPESPDKLQQKEIQKYDKKQIFGIRLVIGDFLGGK